MTSRNSFYGWRRGGWHRGRGACQGSVGNVRRGEASEWERLVAGHPEGVHGDLEKGALPRLRPEV